MQERWAKTVPCRDLAGRIRSATVAITDKAEVAVSMPPGGSGFWTPSEFRQFIETAIAAQMEASHRRGGER